MMTINELLHEVERLPAEEKWQLVRHVLRSLEHEQTTPSPQQDWHTFLRATYGILADDPIQRWDQGEYEEREPFE